MLIETIKPEKDIWALNDKLGNNSLLFSELSLKVNTEMHKTIAGVLRFYKCKFDLNS